MIINLKDKHQFNLLDDAKETFKFEGNLGKVDNLYLMHCHYSGLFAYPYKDKEGKDKYRMSKNFESLLNYRVSRGTVIKEKKQGNLCNELNEKIVKSYSNNQLIHVKYEPLDKLAIGIGETSPYDTTLLMTLHPLYGIPYIPATAIKGMLSHYWQQEINNEEGVLQILFGDQDNQGKLIFFDIFPKKYKLDFDVMTPHYSDYYGGKASPTDDNNPIPITFPCVKEASFDVYIACQDTELLEKHEVKENLEKAFQEYGIGAKTALGYGLGK